MTIYNKKILPYVYRCTHKETGRFYIGYRYRNWKPSHEDFGIHYFTSNEYVRNNFDEFSYEIIAEFFNKKDAFKFESQLISETRCELQINNDRVLKLGKRRTKKEILQAEQEMIEQEKENGTYMICKLPGCEKSLKSTFSKFCCKSHVGKYSALKKAGKI